jgi:hypothetical protein
MKNKKQLAINKNISQIFISVVNPLKRLWKSFNKFLKFSNRDEIMLSDENNLGHKERVQDNKKNSPKTTKNNQELLKTTQELLKATQELLKATQETNQELNDKLSRTEQEKHELNEKIHELNEKIIDLINQLSTAMQEKNALSIRLNNKISDSHSSKIDRTTTFEASTYQLQPHELSESLKMLEENTLRDISRDIFKFRKEFNNEFAQKYPKFDKFEVAKIKSVVSKTLFIEGRKLFEQDSVSDYEQDLVCQVTEAILRYLEAQDSLKLSEKLSDQLKNLCKKSVNILSSLQQLESLDSLIWIEEIENKQFNDNEHRVEVGCKEDGNIEMTTFPGYIVRDRNTGKKRIMVKACVFTILDSL